MVCISRCWYCGLKIGPKQAIYDHGKVFHPDCYGKYIRRIQEDHDAPKHGRSDPRSNRIPGLPGQSND